MLGIKSMIAIVTFGGLVSVKPRMTKDKKFLFNAYGSQPNRF